MQINADVWTFNNYYIRKKKNTMKNLKIITIIILTLGVVNLTNCKKDECEYNKLCNESLNLINDFTNSPINTLGNWQSIGLNYAGVNGNKELYTVDGPTGSYIYNLTDFPQNLIEAGCELLYDVRYLDTAGGNSNSVKSIWIFDGPTPFTGTNFAAKFELSTSIVSGATSMTSIVVPLALGNDNVTTGPLSLPSNSYGQWKIVSPSGSGNEHGSVPLTANLVTQFNDRISGVSGGSGIGFLLDLQGTPNPNERWWFDNFYIKSCCS